MQRTPATIGLVALTTALTATALALAGIEATASPNTLQPTTPFTTQPAPVRIAPVTYAAYGDSITAGIHVPGYIPMESWTVYITDKHITFDSGAFQVGLRSDQIVDSAIARGIPDVNIIVIMGCTNDIAQGVDWHNCLTQWDRLASAAPNVKVIVSAIAPSDNPTWAAETLAYNTALAAHAAAKGWRFADPYAAVRAYDGSYLPGFQRDPSNDVTHPNDAAQQIAAGVLGPVILSVGQPSHRAG